MYLGLVVGAIFTWLAFREVDLHELGGIFTSAQLAYAIPVLLALAGFYALKLLRWRSLLHPLGVDRGAPLFAPMMIGFASNNLLPLRVGELIRVYLADRVLNLGKAALLGTIVIERILDFVAILFWASVALFLLDVSDPNYVKVTITLAFIGLVLVAALVGIVLKPEILFWVVHLAAMVLPSKAAEWLDAQSKKFAEAFRLVTSTATLMSATLNSIAQWGLMGFAIFCATVAVDVQVPFFLCFIVQAIIVAGISLPSAPGFIGTIEYCFVAGLTPFGIAPSEAVSAAVFYHLLVWGGVVIVGMYCLRRYGYKLRDLWTAEP